MRKRLTKIVGLVVVLALLTVGVVVGLRWWSERDRTDLERALSLAPGDGQRFSWTDWDGVRRELGLDLSIGSPATAVQTLLDQGFEADLTSTSALVSSAVTMQDTLGFSPASVDWELFTQSDLGAVVMLGLPDDADFAAIGDALAGAGYERPTAADGTWVGSPEIRAGLGELTPELSIVSLDADEGLIFASDTSAGLDAAIEAAANGGDPADGLAEVADRVEAPLSAALYTGEQACRALAMSGADLTEQEQAGRLIEQAGEVNAMTAFVIAARPGGGVRVAMSFETDDQARTNADTRSVLASGAALGQGGDFADRFELGTVSADGPVVTMELDPTEGAYVVSDLSTGPVLFATC